ncbi:longitudinals lacking protein-like isoform X1 [Toxorhynchites rutilus septentrionalis]|nr:longitudinals lacking protein-like isoform X1 [Toxorhynchites rutilus septentrionalis]
MCQAKCGRRIGERVSVDYRSPFIFGFALVSFPDPFRRVEDCFPLRAYTSSATSFRRINNRNGYGYQHTGTMADQQQYFLKWNDFQTNMVTSFRHLRNEKSFTDVTLACEGQTCKAHKMVLSACSPYFKSLLEENPSKHPIIILKDVSYSHLQAILEFMYAGEVNVSQEQLPTFLKTADRLKVKGLAETPTNIKREG